MARVARATQPSIRFNRGKSAIFLLSKTSLRAATKKIEREKTAPIGIQTHDHLVTSLVLQRCAPTAATEMKYPFEFVSPRWLLLIQYVVVGVNALIGANNQYLLGPRLRLIFAKITFLKGSIRSFNASVEYKFIFYQFCTDS